MNILLLYNATQTFTNTVFEHVASFRRFSRHGFYYAHYGMVDNRPQFFDIDISSFDAVIVHYSIRLPFDQIHGSMVEAFAKFDGLKALFIQDEYDNTCRAWHWIKELGMKLVFTVVPPENIARIYPPEAFPSVRFVNNLTGYVPEELLSASSVAPPSQRRIIVGYRGRPLPVHYGQLGREKVEIGRMVSGYCKRHHIRHDIAWTEQARIYGPQWYEFMTSCRAMLGSESGSNVFDWKGTLKADIERLRKSRPGVSDEEIYETLVKPLEIPGLMNQVSPRVFESIAARTVMVLFEGSYSGVVQPHVHYIPLKKDGSNLDEVFGLLDDGAYVDAMAERAHQEVIASGKYSYAAFVHMVDGQLEQSWGDLPQREHAPEIRPGAIPNRITMDPIRAGIPSRLELLIRYVWAETFLKHIWAYVPLGAKRVIRRLLGRK
jgi:hypothetical protein